MSDKNVKVPPAEYKGELFMVANLLNDFQVTDSQNQIATLKMSQFGFFGVLPVFITRKGAEGYCTDNNIAFTEIFKLQ